MLRSRIRARYDEKQYAPQTFWTRNPQGSVYLQTWPAPTLFNFRDFGNYEYIRDVVGAPQAVKPVERIVVRAVKQLDCVQFTDPDNYVYWPHSQPWKFGDLTVHAFHTSLPVYWGPVVTWQPYQDAALNAFNMMAEQVPEVVSVANFAYELREIKDLIPRLQKTLVSSASGLLLNVEFGWKPLLSDLKKLGDLVTGVEKRLQYLKATWGKTVPIRVRQDLDISRTLPFRWNTLWPLGTSPTFGGMSLRLTLTDYRGIFHASGMLTHRLEGLDDQLAAYRSFRAALGLNNPLKIVWNALPYSFVVDWLLRVNSQLDQFASQPFKGEWTVNDVTSSVKERYTIRVDQAYYPGKAPNVVHEGAGLYVMDRYTRVIGLPARLTSFSLDTLDPRQQLLFGALIGARA